jgi:lysozyme
MVPSKKGIDLIKKYEGCQLKAYKCPAGLWTIGYGNTFYEDGSKVKEGDIITQERSEKLLLNLLPKFANIVNKKIKVEINQNQFDALVSHTWNCGGSDGLFNLINKKATEAEIRNWFETKYITANGKVLKGLVDRRKTESNLYYEKN